MSVKLYNVPRNSKVRLAEDEQGPVGRRDMKKGEVFSFSHIDGAYSYCHDENGNLVHLSASALVDVVEKNDET